MSNLFGRTKQFWRAVRYELLTSDDFVQLAVDALYIRNLLSVAAHISFKFQIFCLHLEIPPPPPGITN